MAQLSAPHGPAPGPSSISASPQVTHSWPHTNRSTFRSRIALPAEQREHGTGSFSDGKTCSSRLSGAYISDRPVGSARKA